MSIRGLAAEFCRVYDDVIAGIIDKKNLGHILDELVSRLNCDEVANQILTNEFISRFSKNYKSWDARTQRENVLYIGRKLSNKEYYNCVVSYLKDLIKENKQKHKIDQYSAAFVRELIDCEYNENYIFQMLHEVFFYNEVSSLTSLDDFFLKFDFVEKSYDVFIGYSIDISSLLPLYEKMLVSDLNVSLVDPKSVPIGIKTKRQKTILKFGGIKSYDMYSAFEIAEAISSCVVNSYTFFRHEREQIYTYGQVVYDKNKIATIRPKRLLKHKVSSLSSETSTKNAEALVKVLFKNYNNLSDFSSITRIHNYAISSESTSDSILSLWSILESVAEDRLDTIDGNYDNDQNKKRERSKIGSIISSTVPYLKSTYIKKLVQTCMTDIIRWNPDFFALHISNNGFGSNDLEHTFAFLTFDSAQPDRDALFQNTETYPLMRYRVCNLSENLKKVSKIKALIHAHEQRIEWHLHRIYRARNYIIHDASINEKLNEELVINLHSYVDTLFSEIITEILKSPYNDSIYDTISNHKLTVLIMDEKLKGLGKQDISAENARMFLYYDFSM